MKTILFALIASGLLLQGCANASKKQEKEKVTVQKSEEKTSNTLSGTYTSDDNPFYKSLVFKGKSTVVIKTIFGIDFPTSYERDENFIRIKTDKSDLLLEIKDAKTLVGEGFAKGTFVKK